VDRVSWRSSDVPPAASSIVKAAIAASQNAGVDFLAGSWWRRDVIEKA
jgi:hypothetical protein